jgi:hypothetical protein
VVYRDLWILLRGIKIGSGFKGINEFERVFFSSGKNKKYGQQN